jgi:dTDP-4-dehydrorhamnose 3,5-epimerase
MRAILGRLQGPLLIESPVHGDPRGFFQEIYRRNDFSALGIEEDFVQQNHSRSGRGIVRGMHFQPGMAKLIHCIRGSILDVLVDIRPGSTMFGQWEAFELSDENHLQLYCPDGFAHGFCVLSDVADVMYGCSDYYDPDREDGFAYDDPEVGIAWPDDLALRASARDAAAPPLRALALADTGMSENGQREPRVH